MKDIEFSRRIPVRHEVDVFVAGGGPAGIAAGVVAARAGQRVFLAEGQNCFGGMGTAALVPTFCPFGDGINFLAAGFGQELLERMIGADGVWGSEYRADGVWASNSNTNRTRGASINVEVLKRVYDDIAIDAKLPFAFQSTIIGLQAEGGTVQAVIVAAKSGIYAVKAGVYIDATGDGDLCAWAGAPFEKGDANGAMMPGTLCSLWSPVDFAAWQRSGIGTFNKFIEQAYQDGVLPWCDKHLPGIWPVGEDTGGGNVGHTFGVDGTDERSLTRAAVEGRRMMPCYQQYFKKYLKGFERMRLMATGSLVGVRETRRILGDYVLNVEDFKKQAVFEDEIGRFCYPIDIHVSRPNDQREFQRYEQEFTRMRYNDGESYGIPYRVLLPQGLSNVLVAGRCVSTDRSMQASIRVMPGCFITGQAAGLAAAMAVEQGVEPRRLTAKALQSRLLALGAYLPNATG